MTRVADGMGEGVDAAVESGVAAAVASDVSEEGAAAVGRDTGKKMYCS